MFESDDFDQVLSQLDLPDAIKENQGYLEDCSKSVNLRSQINYSCSQKVSQGIKENNVENTTNKSSNSNKAVKHRIEENIQTSPKHSKRKLINSYFDHESKRKFPGPAGLLNGNFEDSKDDICHVELLSQDVDYTESYLRNGIFESPLWTRLELDTKDLYKVDSIKNIKQQALIGNLRHQKADAITAYVESVDRSAIDPLIVLRDKSEDIKCTLHRDAWIAFSPYLVSDCCALVLHSPTVLTTGSAFKKHYLNITLRNIQAVYSSAIIKKDGELFPTGFSKIYEEDYTIIRNEKQNTGINNHTESFDDSNLLDGLHGAFSDDIFL